MLIKCAGAADAFDGWLGGTDTANVLDIKRAGTVNMLDGWPGSDGITVVGTPRLRVLPFEVFCDLIFCASSSAAVPV